MGSFDMVVAPDEESSRKGAKDAKRKEVTQGGIRDASRGKWEQKRSRWPLRCVESEMGTKM
jgi:hypothetical protein